MSNYRVHIPDCIIRNENGINLNPKEFALYYYLKILYDKQKSLVVKLNHSKFMCAFGIKDNVTFKKCINNLYNNNLILSDIKELPRQGLISVELNKDYIGIQPFTRLHINLFYLADEVRCEGLRLLYYYESRINRNKDSNQFCFTGIRTIAKETKVNKNKVNEYNEKLRKLKLLKIEKHELKKQDEMYNEFDQELVTKFSNHYTPRLDILGNYGAK